MIEKIEKCCDGEFASLERKISRLKRTNNAIPKFGNFDNDSELTDHANTISEHVEGIETTLTNLRESMQRSLRYGFYSAVLFGLACMFAGYAVAPKCANNYAPAPVASYQQPVLLPLSSEYDDRISVLSKFKSCDIYGAARDVNITVVEKNATVQRTYELEKVLNDYEKNKAKGDKK